MILENRKPWDLEQFLRWVCDGLLGLFESLVVKSLERSEEEGKKAPAAEREAAQGRSQLPAPSKPVYSFPSVELAGISRRVAMLSVLEPVLRFTWPPCSNT